MEKANNDLEKYFRNNTARMIHKWDHYFDIYERHFSRFRNKEIVILEIGVSHGGSLQMWKNYFGEKAKIYGIDIDERCKAFEEENIRILIGSQSDRNFLQRVKETVPEIDILIDDGGHTMQQQIITFEVLFDHVKENGIYLCEDTHTSYWLKWGGGYKRRGTFMEYSKNFIDDVNAFHSEEKRFKANNITRSVDSVHFYDSVVVLEKRKREKPVDQWTGELSFHEEPETKKLSKLVANKLERMALTFINKILRFFRLSGFVWK